MKLKFVVPFLGMLWTLLAAPAGAATFVTGFQELQGFLNSKPSCASTRDGSGDVSCGVVAVGGQLFGIRFNPRNGTSTGFMSVGGNFTSNPGCAIPLGSDDLICAVLGPNRRMSAIRFNPKTGFSTAFRDYGGESFGDPSCAPNETGGQNVICAVLGTGQTLYGIKIDPLTGFNSGFANLGRRVVSSPSCATSSFGTVTCGVVGSDRQLLGVTFDPKFIKIGYQRLGVNVAFNTNPSCAPTRFPGGDPNNIPNNTVACTAIGEGLGLVGVRFDPRLNFKTPVQVLGGGIAGDPSCSATARGAIQCAIIDTNLSLFGIRLTPGPGPAQSTPYFALGQPAGGPATPKFGCAQANAEETTCAVLLPGINGLVGVQFSTTYE
jgi:hypothetical protein